MKGQERFRAELGKLQEYVQNYLAVETVADSDQSVKDACVTLRSLMGSVFGVAEELNDLNRQGVTISNAEHLEGKTLFNIHSFRRPNVYYDLLAFDEAIKELMRVLDDSTDPHVIAAAYNGLGHIYAVRKMYPLAIHYFNKVLEFYPDNSDGYYNLGAAWFNLGSYDEARHYFHQAIYHYPADWEAYFHLGRTYEMLDDTESAMYYIQRAREIKYNCQPGVVAVSG